MESLSHVSISSLKPSSLSFESSEERAGRESPLDRFVVVDLFAPEGEPER
jgi:hypothetical protein